MYCKALPFFRIVIFFLVTDNRNRIRICMYHFFCNILLTLNFLHSCESSHTEIIFSFTLFCVTPATVIITTLTYSSPSIVSVHWTGHFFHFFQSATFTYLWCWKHFFQAAAIFFLFPPTALLSSDRGDRNSIYFELSELFANF